MIINDRYDYTVMLNGVQAAFLEAMVNRGLHGRNPAEVIRRILDAEFLKMAEIQKVDLKSLLELK